MPNKEEKHKHFRVFLATVLELEDKINEIHEERFQVVQVQPTGRKINEINEMAIVTIAPLPDKVILEMAATKSGIPVEQLRIKNGNVERIPIPKAKPVAKAKTDLKIVKKDKPEEKK